MERNQSPKVKKVVIIINLHCTLNKLPTIKPIVYLSIDVIYMYELSIPFVLGMYISSILE